MDLRPLYIGSKWATKGENSDVGMSHRHFFTVWISYIYKVTEPE
jgi:hypothetical protein